MPHIADALEVTLASATGWPSWRTITRTGVRGNGAEGGSVANGPDGVSPASVAGSGGAAGREEGERPAPASGTSPGRAAGGVTEPAWASSDPAVTTPGGGRVTHNARPAAPQRRRSSSASERALRPGEPECDPEEDPALDPEVAMGTWCHAYAA